MGFGIATQTGVSAAIQSIPSMMANKGLRNGYGATFAENFTDGTNTLDPRITFSRASNATVTGSNGLIQYAPHNLLTFSEQFDNAAWTKNGSTITANSTVSPNGSTTADTLVENLATTRHNILFTSTVTPIGYTLSLYVKSSTRRRIIMREGGITGAYASFDSTSGTVVASGSGATATITNVGNGWYRCAMSLTFASGGTATFTVDLLQDNGSVFADATYTGDGVSGIYIWGAQLNVASLQDYNPTTVKNLLGFSEAFDNAAWTKSNSFIQTNLLLQSEAFDNASWFKTRASVTANDTVAPNGTITADKLVEDTSASNTHQMSRATTVTASVPYTYSVYVKAAGRNFVGLRYENAGSTQFYQANVDLTNGTATTSSFGSPTGTSFSVTSAGDGWWRASITVTTSDTSFASIVYLQSVQGTNVYTGDGTSGVFIWGAQLVQGSVAGDYQQTTSAALPVQYQAPNGTMTADKLVENTAAAEHRVQVTPTLGSAPITASVYFKAAERSWSFIRLDDAVSSKYAYFNLATGVVGTVTAGLTASITSVGNGWYRCSALFSAPTAGSGAVIFAPTTGNGTSSYTGDGTSGIYIWGAQLSDSASLDPYVNNPVAAPSSTAFYGARFDYDPVTLQPRGLLIEEQRTNLLTYSEDFSNAAWGKTNVTVTANSMVAPDGTLTADTITVGTSTFATLSRTVTSAGSASGNTMTAYVKQGSGATTAASFILRNGTTSTNLAIATLNYSTGVVTQGTGSGAFATNVGNGWYRIVVPVSSGISAGDTLLVYYGFTGALQTAGDSFNIWGAQLEAGAFATSYIPTTSAQVTRSADSAIIQGSNFNSWFNVNEGTLYSSSSSFVPVNFSTYRIASINDGTTSNQNTHSIYNGRYFNSVTTGGVIQADIFIASSYQQNLIGKLASVYRINDIALSVNGSSVVTDTSATIPTADRLYIGSVSTTGQINGYIRQIAYYPRRLSNSELQAITS